jgi:hypothetical protein
VRFLAEEEGLHGLQYPAEQTPDAAKGDLG